MTTLGFVPHRPVLDRRSAACRDFLEGLLHRAGIRIDGERPRDMQVHDERLWQRIFAQGSLGAGEAYMDGWWDCTALDEFFDRLLRAGVQRNIRSRTGRRLALLARLHNLQSPARSAEVARRHYDLDLDLYRTMLDERLTYSCGYWREADDLEAAQEAKLSLVCRKLGLQPGMHLLDIGCGWGGAARFAAERHGVRVTGITVSGEQARVARRHCRGLPIEIVHGDYRSLQGRFDRIMSIGMFEHVGYKNYRTYFRVARERLAPEGLFLLHTIGGNVSNAITDPWIERYVFPNSMIPSVWQISAALEDLFVIEDWHNFGADYDRTLMSWYANIERGWHRVALGRDRRFRRLWRYYLLSCAGAFRARNTQLWQLLLSPHGIRGGWRTVR